MQITELYRKQCHVDLKVWPEYTAGVEEVLKALNWGILVPLAFWLFCIWPIL